MKVTKIITTTAAAICLNDVGFTNEILPEKGGEGVVLHGKCQNLTEYVSGCLLQR
jgi:hypothetical protein